MNAAGVAGVWGVTQEATEDRWLGDEQHRTNQRLRVGPELRVKQLSSEYR